MTTKKEHRRLRTLDRLDEQYRAMAAELATTGYVLQGSIIKRWMTCGKTTCRCKHDLKARHGPYHVWTYKRAAKTFCVYLDAEQAVLCAEWIQNNMRAQHILQRMREISIRSARLKGITVK